MVSVSGDLGGNSGVVRPGTCRLLFCLLLLVVVVIIIALFGGGVGVGGSTLDRPPPVSVAQPQPPSSVLLRLPPSSQDLRGGGCFVVKPLTRSLSSQKPPPSTNQPPATLMSIHEAHPGRARGCFVASGVLLLPPYPPSLSTFFSDCHCFFFFCLERSAVHASSDLGQTEPIT